MSLTVDRAAGPGSISGTPWNSGTSPVSLEEMSERLVDELAQLNTFFDELEAVISESEANARDSRRS